MIYYRFPAGITIGGTTLDTEFDTVARPFVVDGVQYPASWLARSAAESEADWLTRLAARGIVPVRREPSAADPAYYSHGDPVEAVEDGWIVITPAPELREGALDRARAATCAAIRDGAEAALADLRAEYGPTEVATWDQQHAEALAYQADAGADVPLLNAIAAARGMAVAELAGRVLANRSAWVAVSGHVVGQRLAYQDQLDAAETLEDVLAVVPAYTLPE